MLLSTLLASKAAAAVGSAVIVLGGGAAAAAASHVLPDVLDSISADASDSESPSTESPSTESPSTESPSTSSESPESESPEASESGSPVGPDATGPAAFGLCNAYAHGGVPENSTAYQSLLKAAGTGSIADYCATVEHPGNKPSPSATESASSKHAAKNKASHGKSTQHHGRPSTAPAR